MTEPDEKIFNEAYCAEAPPKDLVARKAALQFLDKRRAKNIAGSSFYSRPLSLLLFDYSTLQLTIWLYSNLHA